MKNKRTLQIILFISATVSIGSWFVTLGNNVEMYIAAISGAIMGVSISRLESINKKEKSQ